MPVSGRAITMGLSATAHATPPTGDSKVEVVVYGAYQQVYAIILFTGSSANLTMLTPTYELDQLSQSIYK